MFSQKANFLQQKIELCNEFLALLKEPVFNNHLDGSGDMKVSNDREYYFFCE